MGKNKKSRGRRGLTLAKIIVTTRIVEGHIQKGKEMARTT
jgi:hypothetical protein